MRPSLLQLDARKVVEDDASSFGYYSLLPTDQFELAPDWPQLDPKEIAAGLLSGSAVAESQVDALTLALLLKRNEPLAAVIDWVGLANRLCFLFSNMMARPAERRLRMKCARANYFLRDLLDAGNEDSDLVVESRVVSTAFPWDWCSSAGVEIVLDCAEKNVHFRAAHREEASFRAGLPTQVDRLQDGLVFGSCYSNGWVTSDDADGLPRFHDYASPVLLVAEHGGKMFGFDAQGNLFSPKSGRILQSVPTLSSGRARLIDGCIYFVDWARPREIIRLEVDGFRTEIVDISPVIVPNDICKVEDRFYLIDKMQGRVFSFDEHFKYINARMSFGKGPGRLYDPISLRVHGGNIGVLSWLTGALATIRPF